MRASRYGIGTQLPDTSRRATATTRARTRRSASTRTALTNVNANARVLTPEYLAKVAALAERVPPVRHSRVSHRALQRADRDRRARRRPIRSTPRCARGGRRRPTRSIASFPDFGGFLVKANSEGQPGPQDYKRTHADGANMLADAVAPHGGVVMWRAFVYSNDGSRRSHQAGVRRVQAARRRVPRQRARAGEERPARLSAARAVPPAVRRDAEDAADDGVPDHEGVPRPGHAPRVSRRRCSRKCSTPTRGRRGKGSTVAKVIDGSLHGYARTGIAGVSRTSAATATGRARSSTRRTGTRSAGWRGITTLSSAAIADEWIRMTFTNDAAASSRPIARMMLTSREAVVNYMTPLGLAHIMATGHHYGPGPWVTRVVRTGRRRTTIAPTTFGIGFDRTATGSNAVEQYFPPVRDAIRESRDVPDSLLLWFHHVRWTDTTASGRTLWDELVARYNAGVDTVRVDAARVGRRARLDRRRAVRRGRVVPRDSGERGALVARRGAVSTSRRILACRFRPEYEQPAHPLSYYMALRCPADPRRPRCPAVY